MNEKMKIGFFLVFDFFIVVLLSLYLFFDRRKRIFFGVDRGLSNSEGEMHVVGLGSIQRKVKVF